MSDILDIKYIGFLNPLDVVATVLVNDIRYELTFVSNYAKLYAIESANGNGIHALPIAIHMAMTA